MCHCHFSTDIRHLSKFLRIVDLKESIGECLILKVNRTPGIKIILEQDLLKP